MAFISSAITVQTDTTNAPQVTLAGVTAGNLLVLFYSTKFGNFGPTTPSTIVDGDGAYSSKVDSGSHNTGTCGIWNRIATSSGSHTVTATFPSTTVAGCIVLAEYSDTVIGEQSNTNFSGTTANFTNAPVTTAAASALYVNVVTAPTEQGVKSGTAGWNIRQNPAGTRSILVQDLVTSGTQTPVVTSTVAEVWLGAMATFIVGSVNTASTAWLRA